MAISTAQLMFMGGEWRPSATRETFEASSPATGELIGTVPHELQTVVPTPAAPR
jgi:acyl-CoA reductase-like NAD-dependent aldehyde dehydrogenase